jgi:hypothetical protein
MRTAISPNVRASVQPQQIGKFQVNRPGQNHFFVPSFDILLKFEGHLSSNKTFSLEALLVTPATPGIDVIIGKDLLDQLSLVSNGPIGKLIVMY